MGRLASSVKLRIEKPKHVMTLVGHLGFDMPVDKLRVVHPTDAARRVDDALSIHHYDGCPGYLLQGEVNYL